MEEKQSNSVGRPRKYTDPQVMQDIIDGYFAECDAKDEPYTVSGICLALDLDRATLIDYQKLDKFRNTVNKSKLRVEQNMEKRALKNESNVTMSIFSLKNNFNWKDKSEVDSTVKQESIIKIDW